MDTYDGPVVFVGGVHYPATVEGEGEEGGLHADLSRPLRVAEGGGYRDAEAGEPLHNDVHHVSDIALPVGGE